MKKIIFLTLVLASCIASVNAQSTEDFIQKLSEPDSTYNSSIQVVECGDVSEQLGAISERIDPNQLYNVYRVNIYFDNGQNARAEALDTQTKFSELFADIPSYLVYENPYFKLTVGNCTSQQEAIILLGKLRNDFPKSFLAREKVNISTILE